MAQAQDIREEQRLQRKAKRAETLKGFFGFFKRLMSEEMAMAISEAFLTNKAEALPSPRKDIALFLIDGTFDLKDLLIDENADDLAQTKNYFKDNTSGLMEVIKPIVQAKYSEFIETNGFDKENVDENLKEFMKMFED